MLRSKPSIRWKFQQSPHDDDGWWWWILKAIWYTPSSLHKPNNDESSAWDVLHAGHDFYTSPDKTTPRQNSHQEQTDTPNHKLTTLCGSDSMPCLHNQPCLCSLWLSRSSPELEPFGHIFQNEPLRRDFRVIFDSALIHCMDMKEGQRIFLKNWTRAQPNFSWGN